MLCTRAQGGRAAPPLRLRAARRGSALAGLVTSLVAGLLAAGITAVAAQDGAAATAPFGDWTVACERTVGATTDDCAVRQTAAAASDAGVVLTVLFVRGPDGRADVLRVLAPLGVLLTSGLSLSVDGEEVGVAGFVRCLPPGCISEVALGEALRDALTSGRRATFAVSLTPQRQAEVPITLAGLGDALDALTTATAGPQPGAAATDD